MTFKEWWNENSEYSWIDPATVESQKAWDYQQAKIDALIEIMCHGGIDDAKSIAELTNDEKLINQVIIAEELLK